MQIVENVALISINGTLIFQLISFLIFLFLINRIMLRPLRQQIGERDSHLGGIARDIAAAQDTCDELNRKMKAEENAVRLTALTLRDEMEAAGLKAAEDLIAKTREEINGIRRKAQKKNEAAIAAVRRELEGEAMTIADLMMGSILGRRIEN